MSLTSSSCPSGAHETDFFFFKGFVGSVEEVCRKGAEDPGGGVEVAGESFLGFIDLTISRNGSYEDGCATLGSSSFLTGAGAFLKLGKGRFGLGAEKKDESDLASLTSFTVAAVFPSRLTAVTFVDEPEATIGAFLVDGAPFCKAGESSAFRFLLLMSASNTGIRRTTALRADVTHPQ